jgi:hypothetical protein
MLRLQLSAAATAGNAISLLFQMSLGELKVYHITLRLKNGKEKKI